MAVKFVLPSYSSRAESNSRFGIEATAAAALQHPNIVAVHEVVFEGEQPFLVMDLIDGLNLAEHVKREPIAPMRAVRYLATIARAIHYAHEQGILHRDLKPSNVLIDSNDQPRVTDFGLGRRFGHSELPEDPQSLTLTGQVLGSPNFLPPEQAGVRGMQVGRHSDVYGLGGVLYFLLTLKSRENPRPEIEIHSLDLVCTQWDWAHFLVGLTAD